MPKRSGMKGRQIETKFNITFMKKLKLKDSIFPAGEVLTKAQMKQVMGGDAESEENSGCQGDATCWYRNGSTEGPFIWYCGFDGRCRRYNGLPPLL